MDKISRLPPVESNSISSFKSFSKGVSLFTIGMGCLVLGGWALDVTALKSVLPGMANMKSNSALLFILAGISLWMQVNRKTPRIAWVFGLIVALVGVLTLGAYVFNSDLGIDQLLFRDTSLSALYPGRMAPFTAMAFLMTGLALMFLDNPSRKPFNESAVIITLVISGLALVGYAYGVSSLYQVGLYSSMAWHTALSFFLLSLAILFARPEQGVMQTILAETPGGSILRRFLPMAILMPVLLGWLGISGERAGLFNEAFGQALIVIVLITTLTIFIWFNAGQLTNIDLSRQQIRHILHEREVHFGNTLDSLMEGCQILGHDWRYLYINSSAEKQNRRPNQELMGNVYMEMWPGVESTQMFDALQRCMIERTPQRMINEFTFPDGAKGWFELSIQPVPDGIFILSSDITKRQQAEQDLLEREMKLSILFDILPVGVSILDAQRKVSYSNPALKKILNISEQELHEGAYQDLKYLRADGTLMQVEEYASVRAFKEKREIDAVEMGVVKEDGSIIWTNVSAVPVDFPDWKLVMVISDITARKKVEEANAYLAAVVNSSEDAIISKDSTSIIASWNMGAQRIFGYTADEMIGQSILNLIPANRIQEEEQILNQISQGKSISHFETLRITKDGRHVDVSVTVSPIKDSTGKIVGASKVARDITKRKQAELEILKLNTGLEEKVAERTATLAQANALLQTMMDNIPDHIFFKDLQGRFISNSKSQTEMLGLSDPIQAIGKTDFDFFPHAQRSFDEEQEVIRSGQPLIGIEESVTWPDGHKTWLSTTKVPLRDQNGQIIGTFGIGRDITDHKHAEAALQKANEQLHELSIIDELTGLYNRRGFLLHAEQQLLLARRTKRNLLIFYADLDGLKQINDQLGHIAGDKAIAAAAGLLRGAFRTSDIKARLGGDEFAILVVEAEEHDAQILITRLRERLTENNQSMSVGVVAFDAQHDISIDDLIARADQAMYIEKRKKPGRLLITTQ